ncbi:hypothetical protein HMPREF9371_2306 [Neisseria shayeganii 871]|uniref:Uncharacterized protein n=1 Tax=Neisseria shayeganii 871 TaxID=1032488 RepID=G4CL15_9NEIS|nr:hypothetical protein HMPREF9371_2306 [Neisseria shayeganii 871]
MLINSRFRQFAASAHAGGLEQTVDYAKMPALQGYLKESRFIK